MLLALPPDAFAQPSRVRIEAPVLVSDQKVRTGPGNGLDGDAPATALNTYEESIASAFALAVDPQKEYAWNDPTVQKEFARLEARCLAGAASDEQVKVYQQMFKNRRAWVSAQTYLQEYAERERLRILSQKLSEIEQYLQPIKLR